MLILLLICVDCALDLMWRCSDLICVACVCFGFVVLVCFELFGLFVVLVFVVLCGVVLLLFVACFALCCVVVRRVVLCCVALCIMLRRCVSFRVGEFKFVTLLFCVVV